MPTFESPNYTQVPNDLFEIHMASMGQAELRVVLAPHAPDPWLSPHPGAL